MARRRTSARLERESEELLARSNEELMRDLVDEGRSDEEIHEVFKRRYAARGQRDPLFVAGRVQVYKRIALRQQRADDNRLRRRGRRQNV